MFSILCGLFFRLFLFSFILLDNSFALYRFIPSEIFVCSRFHQLFKTQDVISRFLVLFAKRFNIQFLPFDFFPFLFRLLRITFYSFVVLG
ncbi:hypothetical protein Y5W_00771 [Alcanivorax sp. 521-1]|uniref:Secreted protein n=1 Tax=Alloalcanivorax profundimaris TaxID=2735259 RepID=A0ABS0APB7_9GAMM|nr:hypothetical protein [Alloalcanivorax profundimaris]